MSVIVQGESFDPGAALTDFSNRIQGAGAMVSFTGFVRDVPAGLLALEIEHYAAMTKRALDDIEQQAISRWHLSGSLIIHRFGSLKPDDIIMMVATAAEHRKAAFEAAEFMMDYLKSRAPFWKKESTRQGDEWVVAKTADEEALKRW
ncbi:MAG: molybdenum cofactor biosynthesis protein MoaE [Paracoccaceae bacterium]